MKEESVSRLEILENILEFYRIQPGMNKNGKIEKIEEYLLLMHALYIDYSKEFDELDIRDIDFLENLFDCFNGYINAVGEEMDKIFEESIVDLYPIPIFGFSIVLPIHCIEMMRNWNKSDQNYWKIDEELSQLDALVESDLFFEHFSTLIEKLMLRINSKLIVAIEELI
jgi:hypothetical protein